MDQGGAQRVPDIPARGPLHLSRGFDDCGRRRQGGHAKPMRGMGSGVFEIALPFRSDAYRVVYAVQIGEEIWVIHALQKKATRGIKTPKREVDLIKDRLRRLKEILR